METKNEPLFTLNMEQARNYRNMLIQQFTEINKELPEEHREYIRKKTEKEIQRVNEWMEKNGC